MAKQKMAWARLDDGFGDHPKVLELIDTTDEMAGAAAVGLWTLGLVYAHRTMRTAKIPGYVPRSFARSARVPATYGDLLCDVGLWEHSENGGWVIHDFDQYLPSEGLRSKRAEAGRRGAAARWNKTAGQDTSSGENAGGDSNLPSDANGKNGNACPEPEPEPDSKKRTTSSSTSKPRRDDVERICRHLSDRIERNGSKRPTIKEGWRDAARLMLDRDGRTEADVHAAIDWCQDSEFWRGNVLSLPKLREKYDQLRLQAARERASPPPRRNEGIDWDAAMARAEARDAAEAHDNNPDDTPPWEL